MKDLIHSSLASALRPLESKLQQLSSAPSSKGDPSLNSDLKEIRAKQQQLLIDTRANTLSSAEAQSQYRSLANIRLKVSNAVEALDDYLLCFSSSEDEMFKAISPIKSTLEEAVGEADDRINLIFKADTEPKYGWKVKTVRRKYIRGVGLMFAPGPPFIPRGLGIRTPIFLRKRKW